MAVLKLSSMVDPKLLPPGPWGTWVTARLAEHEGAGHIYITDATGRKIASIWGPKDQKVAIANFIVEAFNTIYP